MKNQSHNSFKPCPMFPSIHMLPRFPRSSFSLPLTISPNLPQKEIEKNSIFRLLSKKVYEMMLSFKGK